jgi:hypothetical protein
MVPPWCVFLEKDDVYKLILGFIRCQVRRIHLIALEHASVLLWRNFMHANGLMLGAGVLNPKTGALEHTRV